MIQALELYSLQLIFFVAYKCTQKARMFVLEKLYQPSIFKHLSLLGKIVIYHKNEVFLLWHLTFSENIRLGSKKSIFKCPPSELKEKCIDTDSQCYKTFLFVTHKVLALS
jgi:hypothetical protein